MIKKEIKKEINKQKTILEVKENNENKHIRKLEIEKVNESLNEEVNDNLNEEVNDSLNEEENDSLNEEVNDSLNEEVNDSLNEIGILNYLNKKDFELTILLNNKNIKINDIKKDTKILFKIISEKTKLIYNLKSKKIISNKFYRKLIKNNRIDKNLIYHLKKKGYEKLCCLRCIIPSGKTGKICKCRVPNIQNNKIENCQYCDCTGCTWGKKRDYFK